MTNESTSKARVFEFNTIIGMDDGGIVRVINAVVVRQNTGVMDWKITRKMMSKEDVMNSISSKETWSNASVEQGKLVGKSASLDRFRGYKQRAVVILSQIVDNNNRVIGYKVAEYTGRVRNISIKEMVAYGEKASKEGWIPVQNAIFNCGTAEKKGFYKAYPNTPFITERIFKLKKVDKRDRNIETENSNSKSEDRLKRLDDIFSVEQIRQLKLGRQSGVDIRIYANPELSYGQMAALRTALESGVNPRSYASPEFDEKAMKLYTDDIKNGIDIREYTNPKFSLGQLCEISLAAEEGLDISIIADVRKSPSEMAEIRERMSADIWRDELVKKDGRWI